MINFQRRVSRVRALGASLLMIVMDACSSSSADSPPSAADFPARVAELFCDQLGPCCDAAAFPYDRAACEAYVSKDFRNEASRVGGNIAFDNAAAQRCLDQIQNAIRDCSAFDKAQLPDCSHLLIGKAPSDAPCSSNDECAGPPDTYPECLLEASATVGRCGLATVAPHGKLGDACAASCDPYGQCTIDDTNQTTEVACYRSDGLYCSAGQCAAIAALGESCTGDDGCAPAVLCLDSAEQSGVPSDASPGKCRIPQLSGRLATQNLCLGMAEPTQD